MIKSNSDRWLWRLKIEKSPEGYLAEFLPIIAPRESFALNRYTLKLLDLSSLDTFLRDKIVPCGRQFNPQHSGFFPMQNVTAGALEFHSMISTAISDLDRGADPYLVFGVRTSDERALQQILEDWEYTRTGNRSILGQLARPVVETPAGDDLLPFGYPKFWPTVRTTFRAFFEILPALYLSANYTSELVHNTDDKFTELMAQLERLTLVSLSELIVMVGNGHGLGALRITRSMMEYAVNARFLLQNPSQREYFMKWHFIEQHRLLSDMRKDGIDKKLDSQWIERMEAEEAEFEKVKTLFTTKNGKVRTHWCEVDLRSRARAVELGALYDLVNPKASKIVHGTISGLAQQFALDDGRRLRFIQPPSLEECDMALQYGHLSELLVLDVLCESAHVEARPPRGELFGAYEAAWNTTTKAS